METENIKEITVKQQGYQTHKAAVKVSIEHLPQSQVFNIVRFLAESYDKCM